MSAWSPETCERGRRRGERRVKLVEKAMGRKGGGANKTGREPSRIFGCPGVREDLRKLSQQERGGTRMICSNQRTQEVKEKGVQESARGGFPCGGGGGGGATRGLRKQGSSLDSGGLVSSRGLA